MLAKQLHVAARATFSTSPPGLIGAANRPLHEEGLAGAWEQGSFHDSRQRIAKAEGPV